MGRGINVRNRWPIVVSTLLAFALAMVSAPVAALGLGQIEVLSRPGEPLVAEIPVITTDPAELRQLQARLASPETFRRIGLEPPQGAVSNLQFSVALDAQGNPVVRVTSPAPIDQPLLTFLLEVDWGQGRLVREYSVLVDAPESAVAIAQPPIQAPRPAPSSTVVRPADAVQPIAATPDVTAEPLPPAPQATPSQQAPQPVSVPPPASVVEAPPPTQPATPGEYAVERGDTLSEIAAGLGLGDYSLNQTMLALLRANPDAFIDGNINLVRAGAVLRIPGRDVLAELSPSEANAVVQAQVRSWRDRQAPPVIAADAVSEGAGADHAQATDRDGNAAPAAEGPEVADARLQIVPPAGEDGQAPGSRSGLSAGGEGDMLRNDLRQANEDLAARDAEVEELRARLAEVEALQRKQAQLLDLKDSELAAVQQRLAESRADGAAADSPATEATVAQPEGDACLAVAVAVAGRRAVAPARRGRRLVVDAPSPGAGRCHRGTPTQLRHRRPGRRPERDGTRRASHQRAARQDRQGASGGDATCASGAPGPARGRDAATRSGPKHAQAGPRASRADAGGDRRCPAAAGGRRRADLACGRRPGGGRCTGRFGRATGSQGPGPSIRPRRAGTGPRLPGPRRPPGCPHPAARGPARP